MWGWLTGSSKTETDEEKYKSQLDQLSKKGYTNKEANLKKLKLYKGDINLVLMDYEVHSPDKIAKKKDPPKKSENVAKKVENEPKKVETQTKKVEISKPIQKKSEIEAKVIKKQQKVVKTEVKHSKIELKPIDLEKNLVKLLASDVRALVYKSGYITMGEIFLSHTINGEKLYDFKLVNDLLKKFNLGFANNVDYSMFVSNLENDYKRNGLINPYDDRLASATQPLNKDKFEDDYDTKMEYNVNKLNEYIANDIRKIILPYNKELADRLFSFSINGTELNKMDYETVIFVTGIDRNKFTPKNWSNIVENLQLKQLIPFDKNKWLEIEKKQLKQLNELKNIKQELANKQKQLNNNDKSKKGKELALPPHLNESDSVNFNKKNKKKQKKSQPKQIKLKAINENKMNNDNDMNGLYKRQEEQLRNIIKMQDMVDKKTLDKEWYNLKVKQISVLDKLTKIAVKLGVTDNDMDNIINVSQQKSVKHLDEYILTGKNININIQSNNIGEIDEKTLEMRQEKILDRLYDQQKQISELFKLANILPPNNINIIKKSENKESYEPTQDNLDKMNAKFDIIESKLLNLQKIVNNIALEQNIKLPKNNEYVNILKRNFDKLEIEQNNNINNLNVLINECNAFNMNKNNVNNNKKNVSQKNNKKKNIKNIKNNIKYFENAEDENIKEGNNAEITKDFNKLKELWINCECGEMDDNELKKYCGVIGKIMEIEEDDDTIKLRFENFNTQWIPIKACFDANGKKETIPC